MTTGEFIAAGSVQMRGVAQLLSIAPLSTIGSASLPPSQNRDALLGLQLLQLLSSNSIAAFHTALEALPAELVQKSPFIQHPVNLERWLMEGSYSKVWRAQREAPREEYNFFVESLMGTIRCVSSDNVLVAAVQND